MNIQTYSIGELEQITGIRAHTIRIWEKRYRLFVPNRTSTNIRFYTDPDLRKLLNIQILINKGFRISKVAGLSAGELNEQVRDAVLIHDAGSLIDSLMIDMIDFNRISMEKKLNRVLFNLGFEETVNQVIWPFLKKVGILWQTNVINPAQEHFISNIIKQIFFIAIDSFDIPSPASKTFLLFLPENEQHELGLLYSYYLIRKYGHTGIYLGQNVPMIDVMKAWNVIRPDYLVTCFTSQIDSRALAAYLTDLASQAPGSDILASGPQIIDRPGMQATTAKIVTTPEEFTGLLKNL